MQYVYGMRMRGFSIGCQPTKGFVECLEDTSDTFYNVLIYDRRLTEEETTNYELTYLGELEEE